MGVLHNKLNSKEEAALCCRMETTLGKEWGLDSAFHKPPEALGSNCNLQWQFLLIMLGIKWLWMCTISGLKPKEAILTKLLQYNIQEINTLYYLLFLVYCLNTSENLFQHWNNDWKSVIAKINSLLISFLCYGAFWHLSLVADFQQLLQMCLCLVVKALSTMVKDVIRLARNSAPPPNGHMITPLAYRQKELQFKI